MRKGTGKTTSCLNVAGYLAKHSAKVLAVDLDPQSNLTKGLGINNSKLRRTMCHVMAERKGIRNSIVKTNIDNLDLAPASPYLVHTTLRNYKSKSDAKILKKALKELGFKK